jgi:hypothetical protein
MVRVGAWYPCTGSGTCSTHMVGHTNMVGHTHAQRFKQRIAYAQRFKQPKRDSPVIPKNIPGEELYLHSSARTMHPSAAVVMHAHGRAYGLVAESMVAESMVQRRRTMRPSAGRQSRSGSKAMCWALARPLLPAVLCDVINAATEFRVSCPPLACSVLWPALCGLPYATCPMRAAATGANTCETCYWIAHTALTAPPRPLANPNSKESG